MRLADGIKRDVGQEGPVVTHDCHHRILRLCLSGNVVFQHLERHVLGCAHVGPVQTEARLIRVRHNLRLGDAFVELGTANEWAGGWAPESLKRFLLACGRCSPYADLSAPD